MAHQQRMQGVAQNQRLFKLIIIFAMLGKSPTRQLPTPGASNFGNGHPEAWIPQATNGLPDLP